MAISFALSNGWYALGEKFAIMKKVFVIGIGAGNPDYMTIQAINALNCVDVFFVFEKGEDKERSCPKCRSNSIRHLTKKAVSD